MLKSSLSRSKALCLFGLMIGTLFLSCLFKPTVLIARQQDPIHLEGDVPAQFGEWRLDPEIIPVMPDPAVLRKLSSIYSQVLAKTYIDNSGNRVMLSIAYGADQSDDASQVHRPEFCYAAQGFALRRMPDVTFQIGAGSLSMHRLIADRISRHENIAYWVVMSGKQISPGWQRKIEQIKYGLRGEIPDGVLMRISSVDMQNMAAERVLQKFSLDLYHSMAENKRKRYFGI